MGEALRTAGVGEKMMQFRLFLSAPFLLVSALFLVLAGAISKEGACVMLRACAEVYQEKLAGLR